MRNDGLGKGCVIAVIVFIISFVIYLCGYRMMLGPRDFAVKIERVTNSTELSGSLVKTKLIFDGNRLGHDYKKISQGVNRAAFVDHSTGADQTGMDVDQRIQITVGSIKFKIGVITDYQFDPVNAIHLIANYPVENEKKFENEYLFNWVREAMSASTEGFTPDDVYINKKIEFRNAVEESIKTNLAERGIRIINLNFDSDPVPADPSIDEAYQEIAQSKLRKTKVQSDLENQEEQNKVIISQANALKEASELLKGTDPETLNAITRRYLAEKGINPFPAFQVAPSIGN